MIYAILCSSFYLSFFTALSLSLLDALKCTTDKQKVERQWCEEQNNENIANEEIIANRKCSLVVDASGHEFSR